MKKKAKRNMVEGENFAYLLYREEAIMQKRFFKNELVGLFETETFIEVIFLAIFNCSLLLLIYT